MRTGRALTATRRGDDRDRRRLRANRCRGIATRVTHVVASSGTAWGGPTVLVSQLAAALQAKGVESTIVTLRDPHSPDRAFPAGVRYRPCGNAVVPRLGIPSSPAILSTLAREVRDADLVHLHELWHVPQAIGGLLALADGRPYLVSPHGALDPHSLAYYRGLKRATWAVYQRRILEGAGGIHVVTQQEAADARAAGVSTPTRTIPNGVDVERIRTMAAQEVGSEVEPAGRYVVYVGRIDPRKGLDILIQAFAQVAAQEPDVRLAIAGPDSVGLWPMLDRQIRSLGLQERVSHLGYLEEPLKFQLLAHAQFFALPSVSEGMSIALLEAMACGIPCVVSRQCNIPELQAADAGRIVEPTPSTFSEAMLEVLRDRPHRETMARNAARLAKERFSIERMALDMAQFYAELVSSPS